MYDSPFKPEPHLATAFLIAVLTACSPPGGRTQATDHPEPGMVADPHSYSRPHEVEVDHMDLDLAIDFDNRLLTGTATLEVTRHDPDAPLVLDTRDLSIDGVESEDGGELAFRLGDTDPLLGAPLEIELPQRDMDRVRISYRTSPQAAALQWLTPDQTSGDLPFLFSQSQPILARTWLPCQDSPGVRFTYSAQLRVPSGLVALMSAENPQQVNENGRYSFSMPQPIPSYLMALAVGDLRFAPLGERTGVYAEPPILDEAAWEFADVEGMLAAAERLYGEYAWGRYDILVLPPSFPFGGMENPRLTFATPTILAGDRSLVSLIAHELAHSWSGNLATNADWNDFWLNEGFTTYIELRLMEELYGPEYAAMLSALSFQDLVDEVEEKGAASAATHLHLDLAGRDPDAGMTSIAYDKGALLLRTLELELGRVQLDGFLTSWFADNAFESVTTDELMASLSEHFRDRSDLWQRVESQWIHGAGIPEHHAPTTAAAFSGVDEAATAWGESGELPPWEEWNTHQRLRFLRALDAPSAESMGQLDAAFDLTHAGNAEIAAEWLEVSIRAGYEAVFPRLREFLLEVGRRKFLRPLYTALAADEEGLRRARDVYSEARPGYHSVSQTTIDEILGWNGEGQ